MSRLAELDQRIGDWIENILAIVGTTFAAVAAWVGVCEALVEVML